jgi:hypothetical protein
MADVVDRSASPPPSPSPNGGVPTVPPSVSSKPDSSPPSGRDARVDQLTREKYEYKAQVTQAQTQLQEALARIALLEQRQSAEDDRSREKRPQSIQDLSEEHLDHVIQEGQGEDPKAFAMAMREIVRREAERAKESATQQAQRQIELERERTQIQRSVEKDFGDSAWDRSNELYQRADKIYGQMIAEAESRFGRGQGRQFIESMPSLQRRCFELADREIRAPDLAELPAMRRELEQRKFQEGLLSGASRPGPERSEAVKDAIRRRDRKSVFANLDIVKSLERRG